MMSSKKGSFLLSANLEGDQPRLGRRAKNRMRIEAKYERKWYKKYGQDAEIAAEKRPRLAQRDKWVEQERQRTKLPKTGLQEDAPRRPVAAAQSDIGDEAVGKKKNKRMAVLTKKRAQAAQKEATKAKQQHSEAQEAVAGKARRTNGVVSRAAAELLGQCKDRTPQTEQRALALAAEQVAANQDLGLFDVFFELHEKGCDALTRQFAILSAVAVYRDLVPGYRIRENEHEKDVRKSKEVLHLERHELNLLQTYRRLLPALEGAMKTNQEAMAPALAALVKAASEFNYRQRLIGTAVKYANSANENVRRHLVEALQDMVESDQRLEASRDVVLAIGALAQGAAAGKKGMLQHELLQVLLRLPVGRAEEAALREKGKQDGLDEEVQRNMAEASITLSSERLRKSEAELLYEVFCVYLRIMRQRHIHTRELIASALVGLSRWGQQVNLELLLEILNELRLAVSEAIGQADELVALQGLNCALVLLSGPAQAVLTDATWLPDALTRALGLALPSLHGVHSEAISWPPPRCFTFDQHELSLQANRKELAVSLESESVPSLVLRCLDNAIKCPHGFGKASDSSMAALMETLFLLATVADPHVALPILRESATLLKRNRRLHTLLEHEGGLFGLGGVTDRAVSVAWPLQPLACSLSPAPALIGRGLADAIRSRTALLADLFPKRDSKAWLEAEFPQHLVALAEIPTPAGLRVSTGAKSRPQVGSASMKSASFCNERELRNILCLPSV